MGRYYRGIGSLLDVEFRTIFNLTYNTFHEESGIDTQPFRHGEECPPPTPGHLAMHSIHPWGSPLEHHHCPITAPSLPCAAVWFYVQRISGIFNDDYDYREVPSCTESGHTDTCTPIVWVCVCFLCSDTSGTPSILQRVRYD